MDLLIEKHGAVAVVTLNRPQAMNALSRALRLRLVEAFAALDADDAVRAVVLTGAGRAFCAGLDLRELGADVAILTDLEAEAAGTNPVRAIERCRKPVIGAVNGAAITGGFEVALACDLLLVSVEARFADTHARVGVIPGWGLSQKLSRLIGPGRAKELAFTGRTIGARQALDWGLANHLVAPEDLIPQALTLAQEMAALPPAFIARYKRLIDAGFGLPLAQALDLEAAEARAWNRGVTREEAADRGARLLGGGDPAA